ncbi:MAG: metallophosphoesterase family protein [Anaerolineae bacterium]|jgi:Icc-related predicted phosphoesterase|nr:metallophosphoesterase family protein [Anaerolineae bacterium]
MKLLLFSDLHSNLTAAHRLVTLATSADLVIGAGDFCNFHQGLDSVIAILQAIRCPAVLVPGNHETVEALRAACESWKSAYVLHGQAAAINGIDFYGIGGGIPITPFGPVSYDFSEDQATDLLAGCPMGAVLVSHSPPKGAVDISRRGQSLGSVAIRTTIERRNPRLVVCGHIHDSAGKQAMIGSTPVVNAGLREIVWEL